MTHLGEHLRWVPDFASQVVRRAERNGVVILEHGTLVLTEQGRQLARQTIVS